jgi:drug/metabolite transporter (DMT)-like permease
VLADSLIKVVGRSGLPANEMVAFLGLFMAVFLAIYALGRGQLHVLSPHRLDRQIARACLDMANNVCVVIALRDLTLTLFYILIFMVPMVISLLSATVLREGLPWNKAVAIAAGFGGVVIAVHPWSGAREGDGIGLTACVVASPASP